MCIKNTSEFQGVSANDFQFDENRILESDVYDSIMTGLSEAVEDSKMSKPKLTRRVVTIVPVKEYHSDEIRQIRKTTGFSQKLFASYMGVSDKTVEAWEAGINQPSGAASRILSMMEMNSDLITEFPFVKMLNE